MRRRLVILLAVGVGAAFWAGVAHAGYVVGPPSGSTTSTTPTFSAYLEPSEQGTALIWVASDTQMSDSFTPVHSLGECLPSTPTGAQFTFSCQPSYYTNSPNFGGGLPPGTYYWWLTFYHADPGSFFSTLHISGPLVFTVPAPVPPSNAGLVSPYDGATVDSFPTLTANVPAGAVMHFYASLSDIRLSDGSPAGGSEFSCSGTATTDGPYTCRPFSSLTPGVTYYWWVILGVGGTNWIYGPQRFTVKTAAVPSAPSAPSSGSGGTSSHSLSDAPQLARSSQYTGASVKETRLSAAAYSLTKLLGATKSIAIACWSEADWPTVSADIGYTDASYSLEGFYTDLMPHWVELSPEVCRAMETLLHHRPQYPNLFTANAVETLTHEMMHAIGYTHARYGGLAEPLAECYGMQLSIVLAVYLGVPYAYADGLAKYNLQNYALRPASYRDLTNCREDGAWDIFKGKPSPPWHTYRP